MAKVFKISFSLTTTSVFYPKPDRVLTLPSFFLSPFLVLSVSAFPPSLSFSLFSSLYFQAARLCISPSRYFFLSLSLSLSLSLFLFFSLASLALLSLFLFASHPRALLFIEQYPEFATIPRHRRHFLHWLFLSTTLSRTTSTGWHEHAPRARGAFLCFFFL